MINKNALYGLLMLIIFSSCGANRALLSSVQPEEVRRLAYFEPLALISYVEQGNKSVLHDSLSRTVSYKLDSILEKNAIRYQIEEKIIVEKGVRTVINKGIYRAMQQAYQKGSLDGISIPPTIDSLLTSNNTRFGLTTLTIGFDRIKGSYGKQATKGATIGILTLGLFAPIPIKANVTLHVMIFDAEMNDVAFYNYSLPKEKSPADPSILTKEFEKTIKTYLMAE